MSTFSFFAICAFLGYMHAKINHLQRELNDLHVQSIDNQRDMKLLLQMTRNLERHITLLTLAHPRSDLPEDQ